MKKLILMLIVLSSLTLMAGAEKRCTVNVLGVNAKAGNVFSAESLTFFGIDYSRVRLIGDHGHGFGKDMDTAKIRDKYFQAFNSVVVNERKKYDLSKATGGKFIEYKLDSVLKINAKADPNNLRALTKSNPLGLPVVASMVKKYDTKGTKGIGFVIIADQMNKFDKLAHYYVTFFDVNTKIVLFSAYVKGKPGGFGYRNFWLRSVYNVMKDMAKGDWEYWKKEAK